MHTLRRDVPTVSNPFALRVLPMMSTEETLGFQGRTVDAIQASRVDRHLVGLRAWHVEGRDPAMRTERVLGDTRLKRVDRQCVLAAEQFELSWENRQMKVSFLGTDAAVALREQVQVNPGSESNSPTMAASFCFWSLLGLYLENVLPRQFGRR